MSEQVGIRQFSPQGDLVETSFVNAVDDYRSNTLTVHFSWIKKSVSYNRVGSFEHYIVRHGRLDGWGIPIVEEHARYMVVDKDKQAFTMTEVPRRSFYGLQIWAAKNEDPIDWSRAWLGSMDFTSWSPEGGISIDYLVVNKPYDLAINSDDPNEVTLSSLLGSQLPELVDESVAHKFRFVHRLDFATSGCLLLALNSDAARRCYFAFNPNDVVKSLKPLPFVRKYYLALLKGRLEKPKTCAGIVEIDGFVGQDERTARAIERRQMVAITKQELHTDPAVATWCTKPKSASTRILVLEHGWYSPENGSVNGARTEYPATKVLVRILTGRRHQIRTQCLQAGYPVIGDYTYAGDARAGDECTEDGMEAPPRMYLHAWRLRVSTPGQLLRDGSRLLDVVAEDPFTTEKTEGRWKCGEVITPLNDSALGVLE